MIHFGPDLMTTILIPSPLPLVSSTAWSTFVRRMAVASVGAVSDSNALGTFELLPRRLADLGLMRDLKRGRNGKRTVWTGEFVGPMTQDEFLNTLRLQYEAFVASMLDYFSKLCDGELDIGSAELSELTISGALAILHRAGPSGLKSWMSGNRFSATEECYNATRGIF